MADGNVSCNTSCSENKEQGADQIELVVGEGTAVRRVKNIVEGPEGSSNCEAEVDMKARE